MTNPYQKLHYGVSGVMTAPCNAQCPRRSAECHGSCKEYKEYRQFLDDVIEKRNSEARKNSGASPMARTKTVSSVLKTHK